MHSEDGSAAGADAADRHHARENVRTRSLQLGSLLAALAGALLLAVISPVAPVDAGPMERLGTALVLFALVASLPLQLALLVQGVVDGRLRRTAMPSGLVALVRGLSLAVFSAALLIAFALVSGQLASLSALAWAGAAAGLWVGIVGGLVGPLLERSRQARVLTTAVVVVGVVAGIVVLLTWILGL